MPARADLDFKEAQAEGTDFVLMRYARGAEHDGEWAKLSLPATVAFPVKAVQKKGEKGQLVRVTGQLPGDGVAQVRENGPTNLPPLLDGTKETPRAQVLAEARACCGRVLPEVGDRASS